MLLAKEEMCVKAFLGYHKRVLLIGKLVLILHFEYDKIKSQL